MISVGDRSLLAPGKSLHGEADTQLSLTWFSLLIPNKLKSQWGAYLNNMVITSCMVLHLVIYAFLLKSQVTLQFYMNYQAKYVPEGLEITQRLDIENLQIIYTVNEFGWQ